MKDTGFLDIKNNPIHVGDIVEIFSCNFKVGLGEVVEENGLFKVTWFGEYSEGLVRSLKYLAKTSSLKVIKEPLKDTLGG